VGRIRIDEKKWGEFFKEMMWIKQQLFEKGKEV
jgi:hypothetical protein